MASEAKSSVKQNASTNNILMVVAIDFGTTFTGFAYSFKADPNKIFTSKWSGKKLRSPTQKAPTCLLLSPEKKFVAFGYEAQEKYEEILEDDEGEEVRKAGKYYFFERFKMKLYMTKKLNRETEITDIHGRSMLALDVFAEVIGYIKKTLENELNTKIVGIQEKHILWVLTVPAIWSDSAKQFMKEAAEKADIPSNQIKLVLEPEAGSLYCNNMHLCTIAKVDGSTNIEKFPVGQKYIVADLGGGTADIAIHEVLQNRNLREIYRSDGGAYGGSMVDTEFVCYLEEIFGEKVMHYMNERHYEQMSDLRHDFETKKIQFKLESKAPITIKIPKAELEEAASAIGEKSFEDMVNRAKKNSNNEIDVTLGKLSMSPEFFARFFKKAAEGIIQLIKNMREMKEIGEINALLMVGGFSNSEYLQSIIKCRLPGLRIIAPPEASVAILKGAVMFGHTPMVITERIARYTYGFSFRVPFVHGKHEEKLKITEDGHEYCSKVFFKIITKGDVLKAGDHFRMDARHPCPKENTHKRKMPLKVALYRSDENDPKYTAEGYQCELVGFTVMFPPQSGWPEDSTVAHEIVVGESEFTVKGLNLQTGDKVEGKLDFLTITSTE